MTYALYNPATHVAVPREPTQEMLRASSRGDAKRAAVYYRAMLAAAPPHVVEDFPSWVKRWPLHEGYNGALDAALEALRYLASNNRPSAGCASFNAEHLLQIANEIEQTKTALLEAGL